MLATAINSALTFNGSNTTTFLETNLPPDVHNVRVKLAGGGGECQGFLNTTPGMMEVMLTHSKDPTSGPNPQDIVKLSIIFYIMKLYKLLNSTK